MSAPSSGAPNPVRRRRSAIVFVFGIALVAGALWFALGAGSGAGALNNAWHRAKYAPAPLLVATLALPLLNWLLTSAYYFVLTRRYGRVGAGEMASLIGASWLLNYAPLKPGLLGRVAYHKTVNRIEIADSVRVLASAIGAGVCAVLLLLFVAVLTPRSASLALAIVTLGTPAFVCGVGTLTLRKKGHAWRLSAVLGLRYLDALVWAARYAVIFEAIGKPVSPVQAATIAGVSQLVLVIPFAGNGLGLREWAVGLTAATLPGWFASPLTAEAAGIGVAADLLNRAAELGVAILVGVPCVLIATRRLSLATAGPDHAPDR